MNRRRRERQLKALNRRERDIIRWTELDNQLKKQKAESDVENLKHKLFGAGS